MAEKFNHWTKANPRFLDKAAKRLTSGSTAPTRAISSHSLLFLVGTSLLASAVCQKLGAIFHTMVPLIDTSTWTILLISAAALLCASSPIGQVAGSTELSSVFLYCVITLMASRVNLSQLMNVPYWIVTGFLVLIIHAVLMVLICKLLRLDLFTAGTASLANIGGTASAPVLASSYDGTLIPVATMMALMGYAIGTPGGILTANIMKLFR